MLDMHQTADYQPKTLKILSPEQMLSYAHSIWACRAISGCHRPRIHPYLHTYINCSKFRRPVTGVPKLTPALSMQYHVNLILLHRPLLEVSLGIPKSLSASSSCESPHVKACRDSASEVVKLLKIYKQHYTLVSYSYLLSRPSCICR